MKLEFKPITKENSDTAIAMRPANGQEGYIESVEECLREADKRKCWRPVGIYDGERMIGFAMYGFFWEYLPFGRLWMDRLLIDASCQGKGYGKVAMEGLLQRLEQEYKTQKIYLSVYEENRAAIALYQKFGFQFNGKCDVHGEKVMVKI